MRISFPFHHKKAGPPVVNSIKNMALISAKDKIKHDEAGHAKGLACPGCHTESLIALALEDV